MIGPHHLPPAIFNHTAEKAPRRDSGTLNRQEVKRIELIEALQRTKGNQSKAAELLGVSRVTVWNRMRRFGVQYKKSIETDQATSATGTGFPETKRKAVGR